MACNSIPIGYGIYDKDEWTFWAFVKSKDPERVGGESDEKEVWKQLKEYFREEYRADLVMDRNNIDGRGIGPFVFSESFDTIFITEALYNALSNAEDGTHLVRWCRCSDGVGRLDTMRGDR